MASAQTAERVARAFLNGESDHAGAMASHGDSLYSYGLLLARRDGTGGEIGRVLLAIDLDARQQSVTTARHVNALRRVLAEHGGVRVVPAGRWGTYVMSGAAPAFPGVVDAGELGVDAVSAP
jgi:hypothetical protein